MSIRRKPFLAASVAPSLLLLALAGAAPVTAQETVMPPSATRPTDPKQDQERTSFQTHAPYDPMLDLRSDVVMCYGINDNELAKIPGWKAQGYRVHVMTGVAWGEYQDYLYGRWDGVDHHDEVQTEKNGSKIGHGGDVFYYSPGENYGKYLAVGVKKALDAGAEAIHMEEPEFWVRAGWSPGFKREWKSYYHEDWIPPDSSPDAQYRASQLKYYLYGRALKQVFDFIRDYNKAHKTDVKCYVATHSLINYASWGIVSPESSLVKVGADGYIAQVWTGTARTPNVYESHERERTFETAYMEYGVLANIGRATGKTVWFLNDPVEDDASHSWKDYRANFESTLTASLLWPAVSRFEIMPWPERIFHGTYPTLDSRERTPGQEVARAPIPPEYATELMTIVNAQTDMSQRQIDWESGTRGIGVLVSDSMLFQRFVPTPSDPHLGSFYGLSMPLLKRGLPVEPVQLENATQKGTLDRHRVIVATFEGMKPMNADDSKSLALWVQGGGVLVFVDDDKDPYNTVRAWWNTGGDQHYANPRAALFDQMGLAVATAPGTYKVGKGTVIYDAASPAALTYREDGGAHVRDLVKSACAAADVKYEETNAITLRRGPYIIASGLDESLPDAPTQTLTGHFLDLFDASLPVITSVSLAPGSRHLLLDLDKSERKGPAVLAAACKILGAESRKDGSFHFYAEAPDKINAAVRLVLPAPPTSVTIDGAPLGVDAQVWDAASHTLLLRFSNAATGHWVVVK